MPAPSARWWRIIRCSSASRDDPRLLDTAAFLLDKCIVHGGFLPGHDPCRHQRLPDAAPRPGAAARRRPALPGLLDTVAALASPTGQWPEAIHPHTGGGCMGDGQHVLGRGRMGHDAAHAVSCARRPTLILCSGLFRHAGLTSGAELSGPAPTAFGPADDCNRRIGRRTASGSPWMGEWHDSATRHRGAPARLPPAKVPAGPDRPRGDKDTMNIVMMTNTYLPHVGGVARSVAAFSAEYPPPRPPGPGGGARIPRHQPSRRDRRAADSRHPALQRQRFFRRSACVSGLLTEAIGRLQPRHRARPPSVSAGHDGPARRAHRERAAGVHPSHAVRTVHPLCAARLAGHDSASSSNWPPLTPTSATRCSPPARALRPCCCERGVTAPVDRDSYRCRSGTALHAAMGQAFGQKGIPEAAFVVGHLGRLAPEKNLDFLAGAVAVPQVRTQRTFSAGRRGAV